MVSKQSQMRLNTFQRYNCQSLLINPRWRSMTQLCKRCMHSIQPMRRKCQLNKTSKQMLMQLNICQWRKYQ